MCSSSCSKCGWVFDQPGDNPVNNRRHIEACKNSKGKKRSGQKITNFFTKKRV